MDNTSWFRGTPHYWAEALLPFAYALACVEVVYKSSEKAGVIYNKIVEAWSAPRMKVVFDDMASIIPESGKERIREVLIHQENELSPDPKPTTHWTTRIIISILIHVFEVGYQFA
jgi:hypothetical protein